MDFLERFLGAGACLRLETLHSDEIRSFVCSNSIYNIDEDNIYVNDHNRGLIYELLKGRILMKQTAPMQMFLPQSKTVWFGLHWWVSESIDQLSWVDTIYYRTLFKYFRGIGTLKRFRYSRFGPYHTKIWLFPL
eukprot:Sdes_comp20240_c0_seq1m13653